MVETLTSVFNTDVSYESFANRVLPAIDAVELNDIKPSCLHTCFQESLKKRSMLMSM